MCGDDGERGPGDRTPGCGFGTIRLSRRGVASCRAFWSLGSQRAIVARLSAAAVVELLVLGVLGAPYARAAMEGISRIGGFQGLMSITGETSVYGRRTGVWRPRSCRSDPNDAEPRRSIAV